MEIAAQDDYVFGGGGRLNVDVAYERAREMGMSVVRVNVISSEVAGKGWERLDALVDRIRLEGMIPQVTIMGRPRWYVDNQPDGGCPHIDPDPAKYARFCTAVVRHFGGRVGRYALWNEPNHKTFLQSTTGKTSELYARLYHAGFKAVRSESPKAMVLWGEMAGGPTSRTWMKEALKAGYQLNGNKPVIASGFAIHPYQFKVAPSTKSEDDALRFGDMSYLKLYLSNTKMMRTTLNKPVPIYITEMGWFNEPHKLSIPDQRRAQWIAEALDRAEKLGIRQWLQFTLTESPGSTGGWDTGIVKLDGSKTLTFKVFEDRR